MSALLSRPNHPHALIAPFFHLLGLKQRPVHHRPQRRRQVGFHHFAGVAFVALMHQDVRCAEQLGFRPLLVIGQAFEKIGGAREKQRRPTTTANAGAREAIDRRALGERLIRAVRVERCKRPDSPRKITSDMSRPSAMFVVCSEVSSPGVSCKVLIHHDIHRPPGHSARASFSRNRRFRKAPKPAIIAPCRTTTAPLTARKTAPRTSAKPSAVAAMRARA